MVLCHSMNAGLMVGIPHEVLGILKTYHMLKNLFELFTLNGGGTQKLWVQMLAPEPPGETFTT